MSNLLIKKTNLEVEKVFPKTYIHNITDKKSNKTLELILNSFNMYFLSYTGNVSTTRCLVPMILRKKGLWITYVNYDGNVCTEWYAASDIDDESWGDSSNWRIGNNTLVGDITISSNGNWVINGAETEFKAVGEKGNTPLIRIADNRLQVSYDLGDTYSNVTENPVYTQFRFNSLTNTYQVSYDLGSTWLDVSDEKVYYKFRYNGETNTHLVSTDLGQNWTDVSSNKVYYQFRTNDNRLLVSTDLGTTWENCSEPIAAWFRWADTSGTGNVGKVLISRDLLNWEDLSPVMTNNLYIKGYVSTIGNLPSSANIGDIYMVGPTYDESDTTHDYPHYRMWVKLSSGWVDNGEYLSNVLISLTTGLDTGITMSLKAITNTIVEETARAKAAEQKIIFDVSANNDGAVFESLSALLNSSNLNTLIPTSVRHGGMTIRFVRSSDNKYVQYFLTKNTWSVSEVDWEKMNLEEEVADLDKCIINNIENSNNLLRPNIEFKKEGADAEFIGFTIKVTATNNGTYRSIQIPIDTNGKQTITISNKNYSGTGSGSIRIASSDDGVTKKDWLDFVPSNGFKTFYVSGLKYILVYLYAVYEDNAGTGNYIIYDSIQVEEGTQPTEYKGFKILKDIVARENINFIQNRVQTIQDFLVADRVKSVDLGYCYKNGIRVEYIYPLNFNIAIGSLIVSSDNTWAAVRYIDADGNKIYDSTWIKKPSTFKFSTEGYEVSKISVLVRNSSNIDLPLEEIIDRISLSFDVFTHTQEQLDNITIKNIGVGERIYNGEKINLKDIHTCDMKLWKEFGYEEDKQWRENQSMNIYNDIVFLFLNGGKVHCLSYKTKEYISSFQIESNANHANNAVWLYKYASDDIYPLIAVSRCSGVHQECLVYRIANDLTNAELVSTINCTNDGSYDSSFVFDNNGYIYKLTYTKGNYDSGDANGNRIRIMGWWMPDLVSTITLNQDDAVIDVTLPFTTIQGAQIHNGLLYLANVAGYGKKVGTNGIWVIDINSARVISRVQRTTGEMEGICIYNNHIYTSQRSSSISEVPNLKIYEWSF